MVTLARVTLLRIPKGFALSLQKPRVLLPFHLLQKLTVTCFLAAIKMGVLSRDEIAEAMNFNMQLALCPSSGSRGSG